MRRALQSTAAIVTASASAARGPNSAAPASAPTALTEIDAPISSDLERERLADADEATIASRPRTSVRGAVDAARATPAPTPTTR